MSNYPSPSPCPHCGGTPFSAAEGGGTHTETRIVCNACGSQTDLFETNAQAVAAWNRRDEFCWLTSTTKLGPCALVPLALIEEAAKRLAHSALCDWRKPRPSNHHPKFLPCSCGKDDLAAKLAAYVKGTP